MVSTPKVFYDNSPISPMTPTSFNKPSARKSLCLFTNILDIKKKTVRSAKSKRKAIKYINTPWSLKPKQKLNSKINNQIKKSPNNYIMNHPQVVQSSIFNYCLKVNTDGPSESLIVSKLLIRVSIRKLHNSLVSYPVYGGLKEARYA